jgi:hypothetical protein
MPSDIDNPDAEGYILKGLDEQNYAIKEMRLWLRKPAEIKSCNGGFWDGKKIFVHCMASFSYGDCRIDTNSVVPSVVNKPKQNLLSKCSWTAPSIQCL